MGRPSLSYAEAVNARMVVFICALIVSCGSLTAQSQRCPIVAKLPADLKDAEAPQERRWFELRQCNGEGLVVSAYERMKQTPSLTFDTGYGYPVQLVHSMNVLVLESIGGSANQVFVFTFHEGKPSVALQRSTAGDVQVQQTGKDVIVTVPVKTYPDASGTSRAVPDAVYRFSRE
ncbi:MAG TPA: hypothetical protein VN893_26675 [Bryobacteraceae bacterium]|jgi:hypothetical protein|nr:hypothetical protein [Bryobacteraceae bacterium]